MSEINMELSKEYVLLLENHFYNLSQGTKYMPMINLIVFATDMISLIDLITDLMIMILKDLSVEIAELFLKIIGFREFIKRLMEIIVLRKGY